MTSNRTIGYLGDRLRSLMPPRFGGRVSMAAQGDHVGSADYGRWVDAIGQPHGRHRKVWEWCYILQAFEECGLLRSGASAIGFGVGTEPLVAVLAARGVRVLATDQASESAGAWSESGQHAAAIDAVRRPDLCPPEAFDERVSFRAVDMRSIPADLSGFDAAWSSCCFEHLGSPDAGFDFVASSLETLRPGGLAVHTTELDVGTGTLLETGTVERGDYVCFYRRRDLERLVVRLRGDGHDVRCNFRIGSRHPLEAAVDMPPYSHDPHLRLGVQDRVVTSFGLAITRAR